ncbi:hypothetical protein [Pelosinus fermentans]|nr:hypothetical protein [Pelosinus fermentans]
MQQQVTVLQTQRDQQTNLQTEDVHLKEELAGVRRAGVVWQRH